jgi:hypothetical protein
MHDIDARVEPSLASKLKADGEGWIVPSNAAPFDYGIVPGSLCDRSASAPQLTHCVSHQTVESA